MTVLETSLASVSQKISSMTWHWAVSNTPWTILVLSLLSSSVIQRCAAVTATVQGGPVPGHVESIVQAIKPAIDVAKDLPGNLTDNTIKANARLVASQIQSSQPILSELARLDKIAVVSAYCDIENGEVHIL